ncbi:dermonecrotic toxin domain-containing protein [Martelella alba]|uniref:Dermonecrotic toxin N-terminal domain-containing protein n=1 Tax=Martelella alba TaxID=2590451 RepID=A0ABY2SM46_9HYPH|nr:DUF6543 domain-containing protein [Martelella alba]TKI06863.1 hypothetical protein FCN80_07850 [Martelella alba]
MKSAKIPKTTVNRQENETTRVTQRPLHAYSGGADSGKTGQAAMQTSRGAFGLNGSMHPGKTLSRPASAGPGADPAKRRATSQARGEGAAVNGSGGAGSAPILATLTDFAKAYAEHYPEINKIAADAIKSALFRRTGIMLDPDRTYFHRFSSAQNDPASVTGWRHGRATPILSATLTQCVLNNFSADAQDNMDVVDQMSGIYTEPAHGVGSFGHENQVAIKPSLLAAVIHDLDFSAYYLDKLERYWQSGMPDHFNLVCLIIALASLPRDDADAARLILRAFDLLAEKTPAVESYLFVVDNTAATDILVIKDPHSARQVIYLPGENPSFVCFEHPPALATWLRDSCANPSRRAALARHFPLRDRQPGVLSQGVDRWLADCAKGQATLGDMGMPGAAIGGDLLSSIRARQKERALSDADILITSNAEVNRDRMIRYISVMNMLFPNPITAFVSLGLNIEKMVDGDNPDERREAMIATVDDLANIALQSLGAVLERWLALSADVPAPAMPEGRLSHMLRKEMARRADALDPQAAGRKRNRPGAVRPENVPSALLQAQSGPPHRFRPSGRLTMANSRRGSLFNRLKARGIGPSSVPLSRLSKADLFGVRYDKRNKPYLLIDGHPIRINKIKRPGYYTLGKRDQVGVYVEGSTAGYRVIPLRNRFPVEMPLCREPRSFTKAAFHYCLHFSPRAKKTLGKFIMANPDTGGSKMNIIYNRDKNYFIDEAKNQKYILYAKRYFPIQEHRGGYDIFSDNIHRRQIKIIRVYFSKSRNRNFLISRLDRLIEIFNSPAIEQYQLRIKPNQALTAEETYALAEFRDDGGNRAVMSMPARSGPAMAQSVLVRQGEHLRSALAKIRPAECTVYKMGQLPLVEWDNIHKNDFFVTDRFILADLREPLDKDIPTEPGNVLVKFVLQMKKRGYPIDSFSADGRVLIKDKTYFRIREARGRLIVMQEAPSPNPVGSRADAANLRRLDFAINAGGTGDLLAEGEMLRRLLSQKKPGARIARQEVDTLVDVLILLAKKQVHSPALEDYTEAGSDAINNWLRFDAVRHDPAYADAGVEARLLLRDFDKLYNYDGYAYRSANFPAGVYGKKIVTGDVVLDKGFMSASALPGNSIEWKDQWSKTIARSANDQVIFVIDRHVPKKVAGTGFLVDHLLLKPGTALKIVEIMAAEDRHGMPVKVICVASGVEHRLAKDIFSGEPLAAAS